MTSESTVSVNSLLSFFSCYCHSSIVQDIPSQGDCQTWGSSPHLIVIVCTELFSGSVQCCPPAVDAERHQDGAAEGPTPSANEGSDTPTTASSTRVLRQGVPSSSNLAAPSPAFAAADSAALRSYNLK